MAITVPSMRTMHPAAIHGDRHEPSNRGAPCKEFRSIRRIRKQELASKTGPSVAMDDSNITEIKAQAFIEGQLIADCEYLQTARAAMSRTKTVARVPSEPAATMDDVP